MGLDKIVHHDRESQYTRIFNSCIKYWESETRKTRDQENEQRLLQKYNNLRFLDDQDNQTYMIAPENLEFKGSNRKNNQYCLVRQTLDGMDRHNVDLLISRDINDDFMILIKGIEQDPYLGRKLFIHQLMMIAMLQKFK